MKSKYIIKLNSPLSNLYTCYIRGHHGTVYRTAAHYFIKTKQEFFDKNNFELGHKILYETDGTKLLNYSRMIQNYDDKIWNNNRYNIMLRILNKKFTENEYLYNYLIQTENKYLLALSYNDKIWGATNNMIGNNLLGIALMETRYMIKK
jgi:ribA/ribD-fused uncharacterized protein